MHLNQLVSKNKIAIDNYDRCIIEIRRRRFRTVAQGFGAAMVELELIDFKLKKLLQKMTIPVFAIVIKQSIKEAINLMTKEIADKAEEVRSQIYDMINDNTSPGKTVLVIGVGNTIGVSQ